MTEFLHIGQMRNWKDKVHLFLPMPFHIKALITDMTGPEAMFRSFCEFLAQSIPKNPMNDVLMCFKAQKKDLFISLLWTNGLIIKVEDLRYRERRNWWIIVSSPVLSLCDFWNFLAGNSIVWLWSTDEQCRIRVALCKAIKAIPHLAERKRGISFYIFP